MAESPTPPRRLLAIRTGAIGDVCNALVFASALKRGLPGLEIGWLVHPLAAPLVVGHPDVDRVHLWPRRSGLRGALRVLAEVRATRYDTAVDLQRLQKSAAFARLSGAARIVGFERKRVKESSWIWTSERVPAGPAETHMLETYLAMARHFVPLARADRRLPQDPASEAWAEALVDELGAPPTVLNLGASRPAKRWEPERFGRLAGLLHRGGAGPLVLSGGPGDLPAAALANEAGASVAKNLVGRTSLPQLIALLRRSARFIGCDTGPMHLAAAVGCPVVALFGPIDERRTGPYGLDRNGHPHRVLRERLPCAPCGLKRCPLPRHACMLDLHPERIAAEALAVERAVTQPHRS